MSIETIEAQARLALEVLLSLPSGYLAGLSVLAGTLAAWCAAGPRSSGIASRLIGYVVVLLLVLAAGVAFAHFDGDLDLVEVLTRRTEPDVPPLR